VDVLAGRQRERCEHIVEQRGLAVGVDPLNRERHAATGDCTMPVGPLAVASGPLVDHVPPMSAVPNPVPVRLKSSAATVVLSYWVESYELSSSPCALPPDTISVKPSASVADAVTVPTTARRLRFLTGRTYRKVWRAFALCAVCRGMRGVNQKPALSRDH
jgi:hypothetical protein